MCASPTLRRLIRRGAGAALLAGAAVAAAAPGDEQDPFARPGDAAALEPPGAPAPSGTVRDRAADLVIGAMNFLGVPYRHGGASDDRGFDCSGFTRHVFEAGIGMVLPRRVDEQAGASGLVAVARDELRPGDLVFFNTLQRTFSHVGIYIGEGRFIHAPRAGGAVRVEDMRFAYWSQRFTGARRASLLAADAAGTDNP
jgi:cell wall-associated NlpC family hydrolase